MLLSMDYDLIPDQLKTQINNQLQIQKNKMSTDVA